MSDHGDDDDEEYVPSNRVILAPIILTPAKLCEKKVEAAVDLIDISFGCAKNLQQSSFADDSSIEVESKGQEGTGE
jgi:hypothetical protein